MKNKFFKILLLSSIVFALSFALMSCDWLFGTGSSSDSNDATYTFKNECGRSITLKFDRSYRIVNPYYNPESSSSEKYNSKSRSESYSLSSGYEVKINVKGGDLGFTWSAGAYDHEVNAIVGSGTILFNKKN